MINVILNVLKDLGDIIILMVFWLNSLNNLLDMLFDLFNYKILNGLCFVYDCIYDYVVEGGGD